MSGLMMSSASGVKSSKTCKPIDRLYPSCLKLPCSNFILLELWNRSQVLFNLKFIKWYAQLCHTIKIVDLSGSSNGLKINCFNAYQICEPLRSFGGNQLATRVQIATVAQSAWCCRGEIRTNRASRINIRQATWNFGFNSRINATSLHWCIANKIGYWNGRRKLFSL